ncbi:MAG: hypothetical protein ABIA76_01435 [Candidatus Diapherotrites archaeon]
MPLRKLLNYFNKPAQHRMHSSLRPRRIHASRIALNDEPIKKGDLVVMSCDKFEEGIIHYLGEYLGADTSNCPMIFSHHSRKEGENQFGFNKKGSIVYWHVQGDSRQPTEIKKAKILRKKAQ